MAIPKNVSFVTFDVYGTLIDWETGAYDAFKAEADRDGFSVERGPTFRHVKPAVAGEARKHNLDEVERRGFTPS